MEMEELHNDVPKPEPLDTDPFEPFQDIEPKAGNILTFRAIFVGCLCGALVNASNIYLGLKTGLTSTANILGSIVGFTILKNLSFHHHFGVHENNIVQTVATAAGGMSNVYNSAIPALYQLNLLNTPPQDFLRLVTLTAAGGYFGLLSVVPLRKFFIEHIARDMNLIFPSSYATATTIRSMHLAASGARLARERTQATVTAFLIAMLLRVLSTVAMGIFWDWHVFTWLRPISFLSSFAIAAESWGWCIEWSPAVMGSGMLVGMNVASSFFAGSVLAWGIIGPYLVSKGIAYGQPASNDSYWNGLMSYTSMEGSFASAEHPSPRYWLLWPGVACMLAVAFTGKIFWTFSKIVAQNLFRTPKKRGDGSHQYSLLNQPGQQEAGKAFDDSISTWMWAPGLVAAIVVACLATKLQFGMTILETLLALILAFILSLIAIQATGATDATPLGPISKVSQIVLSTTTSTSSANLAAAQRLNLLGGSLTNIGADQACALMGDFRVGFLLSTPARLQYFAQLIGTVLATLIAPAMFLLFSTAYPCVLAVAGDATNSTMSSVAHEEVCEFASPSAVSWRAVAIAATLPSTSSPVPPSSLQFSIILAALASVMVLVKNFVWVGKLEYLRAYQPNMMILAMAFTLPSPKFGLSMLMGGMGSAIWQRWRPDAFERIGFSVAAGLVAGEGIGGTVNGVLSILGMGGDGWRTVVGCPAGRC